MTLMHGYDWSGEDVTGWMMSEKLDGLRALWTGRQLLSREGHLFRAPQWFIDALPVGVALDGELYGGPGTLAKVAGMFRRSEPRDEDWRYVRFNVFDAPDASGGIVEREAAYQVVLAGCDQSIVRPVIHSVCRGLPDLITTCRGIQSQDGEGVMLRNPYSSYTHGRTRSILKFKPGPVAMEQLINGLAGAPSARFDLSAR